VHPNIGIVGRLRTGKDTIAGYLTRERGYARVALADPLRALALKLDPIVSDGSVRLSAVVDRIGWEQAKDTVPEVRRTLQRLGTDVIRHGIAPDTWVSLAVAQITRHNAEGRPVVIPDVRFPNEVRGLAELVDAEMWRVTRASAPKTTTHESESHADTLPVTRTIANDGEVSDLFRAVDSVLIPEKVGAL
jgi:hypothetical protein